FFIAARIGGAWMDSHGAKMPVARGFLIATIGMIVWAQELSGLSRSDTLWGMLITGAGFGLIFSPLNADALNRLPDSIRGQGSGITQTFRNFGSALGMAIMGTVIAGDTVVTGPSVAKDFASAMETAWYVGAGFLAVGFLLSHFLMESGKQKDIE